MKINNRKIFALALRTAIVVVISFIVYEVLINLEKILNKNKITNKLTNEFIKRFTHFAVVFVSDITILYLLVFIFKVHL
jgi:predicted nucleic acid-binding protein